MLTIYSKDNCSSCESAKAFLAAKEIPFEVRNCDNDWGAFDFIAIQGFRSFPQIFKGTELFVQGGWAGLKAMQKEEIIKILYGENADILDTASK